MNNNPNSAAKSPAPALADNWMDYVTDYHRVAYSVVGQARYAAMGRFALTTVEGGFGTPPFADTADGTSGSNNSASNGTERCVCVMGDQICICSSDDCADGNCADGDCADGNAQCQPITTLDAAAKFVGIDQPTTGAAEHDSPELGDINRQLNVSQQVGETLAWWYALGAEVLGELVSTPGAVDPEEVTLWPGHFDIATAVGADGKRATYGLSPGDHSHPEPYVYVGPWSEIDKSDSYWNDEHFSGASLGYQNLLGAADPTAMVMEFLRTGYNKLN